jgi:hypothetical protein
MALDSALVTTAGLSASKQLRVGKDVAHGLGREDASAPWFARGVPASSAECHNLYREGAT